MVAAFDGRGFDLVLAGIGGAGLNDRAGLATIESDEETTMPDPFDREALLDRVDGDAEFLAETVEILDEDAPPLLGEIREAAGAQDVERLARAAHTLKGMLANFCAEPATTAARHIEEMARRGELDGVETAITTVEQESERLKTALAAFVAGLDP